MDLIDRPTTIQDISEHILSFVLRFTEFPRFCSLSGSSFPIQRPKARRPFVESLTVVNAHAVRELDGATVEPNPCACRTARSIPATWALALLEHRYSQAKSVSFTSYHANWHKNEFRRAARSVQAADGGLERSSVIKHSQGSGRHAVIGSDVTIHPYRDERVSLAVSGTYWA
jgi:hypothetical protein